jgi:hypothetical protein
MVPYKVLKNRNTFLEGLGKNQEQPVRIAGRSVTRRTGVLLTLGVRLLIEDTVRLYEE